MKQTNIIIGVVLIVLAGLVFAVSMGWLDIALWTVLSIAAIVLGAALHVYYLASGQKHTTVLLPAAISLVYGVLFLIWSLRDTRFSSNLWSLFLLGPGLGFFEMYLLGGRHRSNLWPAAVLLSLGLAYFVQGFDLASGRNFFVPVLLLCAGVFTILFAFTPRQERRQATPPGSGQPGNGQPGNGQAYQTEYAGIEDPHMARYARPKAEPEKEDDAPEAAEEE